MMNTTIFGDRIDTIRTANEQQKNSERIAKKQRTNSESSHLDDIAQKAKEKDLQKLFVNHPDVIKIINDYEIAKKQLKELNSENKALFNENIEIGIAMEEIKAELQIIKQTDYIALNKTLIAEKVDLELQIQKIKKSNNEKFESFSSHYNSVADAYERLEKEKQSLQDELEDFKKQRDFKGFVKDKHTVMKANERANYWKKKALIAENKLSNMRGSRIADRVIERIIRKHIVGMPQAGIASECKVSVSTVNKYVKQYESGEINIVLEGID